MGVDLEKAKEFYEEQVYGHWRSGERVSYTVVPVSKRIVEPDPNNPFATMFRLSTTDEGKDVEIHVQKGETRVTFTVRVYLPKELAGTSSEKKLPFLVCMHPIQPKDYVLQRGCAVIFLDTAMIAEDNCLRRGCFYELYPYDAADPQSQTGELMAWSWGAAKVLDAVEAGLGEELCLDIERSMVTGVSRWGKATAVCGAFEKRFRVVIPTCSGAGGLALWDYRSEGKTYDLSCWGCPSDYVYGKNEPLDCLQSDAERGWFIERFREYKEYKDIPVEQYMLPVLSAEKNHYYFIIAAWMGEDWVNAPAMWENYEITKIFYEKFGLARNLYAYFHKEGHAVLEEDLKFIFEKLEEMHF